MQVDELTKMLRRSQSTGLHQMLQRADISDIIQMSLKQMEGVRNVKVEEQMRLALGRIGSYQDCGDFYQDDYH